MSCEDENEITEIQPSPLTITTDGDSGDSGDSETGEQGVYLWIRPRRL